MMFTLCYSGYRNVNNCVTTTFAARAFNVIKSTVSIAELTYLVDHSDPDHCLSPAEELA
jgi:hypothetical protein